MPNRIPLTMLAASGVLLSGLSAVHAQTSKTISFNFAGNSDVPQNLRTTQSAGVGAASAPRYNQQPGSVGTVSTLAYSDGTVSGASLTFNSYDAQNNSLDQSDPNFTNDPNSILMNGFIESGPASVVPTPTSSPSATVSLSGLSFSSYSVYVYFFNTTGNTSANPNSEAGTFTVTTGSNPTGVSQNIMTQTTFNPSSPFTMATATTPGDYIVFTGLTGSTFTLTGNRRAGDTFSTTQIPISGFQIVGITAAPEPAAFIPVVIGLGMVGLLAAKRRRAEAAR